MNKTKVYKNGMLEHILWLGEGFFQFVADVGCCVDTGLLPRAAAGQ